MYRDYYQTDIEEDPEDDNAEEHEDERRIAEEN